MWDTSARLLKLLSLLQSTRDWTGADLADRLEVSRRTVRRDVDRLRELGYPVSALMGSGGGYRLEAGAAMPPLLLDDEEAVAIAIGLQTAAAGSVAGIEESSIRALSKLRQVMPSRLRRRFEALQAFIEPVGGRPAPREQVPAATLNLIADACRDQEGLRFDYLNRDGLASRRQVEPYRLVSSGRRWYLVAFDLDRAGWRSFRLDRMELKTPNGARFSPRELPEGGAGQFVASGIRSMGQVVQARILVQLPATDLAAGFGYWGTVEAVDEGSSMLTIGGESLRSIASWVSMVQADFQVLEPLELRAEFQLIAERVGRAALA
ncbi:WYL domain-containing protein [Nakamurella silvestris]|nr:WYL domain-containing protein [Nakamurella silvestris]